MVDRTICNWKKTRPPSSGHSVFSSSLVIPSRVAPLRPPRQRMVLPQHARKSQQLLNVLKILIWNEINCADLMSSSLNEREANFEVVFINNHINSWKSCSHFAEGFVFQPHLHLCRPGPLRQHRRTSKLLRILNQKKRKSWKIFTLKSLQQRLTNTNKFWNTSLQLSFSNLLWNPKWCLNTVKLRH